MNKQQQQQHQRQSGSALVVVLGLLAVIMLMAVAFSIYMRTERAGTTNLRHALVAKQMMQSAIARTMQTIDESFEDPKNTWAAPNWDEPYLTSHEPTSADTRLYQSAPCANDAERTKNARVLTREIMMHLTPGQLALAGNAKIDWASINSGVSADSSKDPIMGRYAFVAFDVSGLHDMNKAGADDPKNVAKTYKARATDFGTNAVNYQVGESLFFNATSGTFKPDYDKFVEARAEQPFMSMADLWRRSGIPNGPESYKFDIDKEIVPDIFTTYSMSLEGLAPDGAMKLPLATLENDAQKTAYAKLAAPVFKKMFDENGGEREFRFKVAPKFTRSQLATQALVDYLDEDDVPCGGIDNGRNGSGGHLNFPCTEPVPLITQAMAYFSIGAPKKYEDPSDPLKSYQEWEVSFFAVCEAQFLNDKVPANLASKKYQLKMELEFIDLYDLLPVLWGPEWQTGTAGWKVDFIDAPFMANVQTISSPSKSLTAGSYTQRTLFAKTPDAGVKVLRVRAYNKASGSRKFSQCEEQLAKDSVRTEIRIKAQVLSGSTVVQQVPAPILEARAAESGYRLKLAPGLYRNPAEAGRAAEKFEFGWAMCLDPRFAYNTETMGRNGLTGSVGPRFWVNNDHAHDDLLAGGDAVMKQIAGMLTDAELAGSLQINALGNWLIKETVFSETAPAAVKNIADMWTNKLKIYPDAYHLSKKGGKTFLETDMNDLATMLQSRITNLPMVSPGELGNLLIGPWETLSLFASFPPDSGVEPTFHRALDYFCMGEARYPTMAQIAAGATPDRHLAALQSGRINLNPQRLVVSKSDISPRGEQILDGDNYPEYNSDPLVCVLTGACINEKQATQLEADDAEKIAEAFYAEAKRIEKKGSNRGALMISRLSDLGQGNAAGDVNPVLQVLMDAATPLKITCDAHREALIANSVNALTTRGLSFLVIIRAEAFSPRYGSDSPDNGTTLSTTYAVVELWRDPEPMRDPQGAIMKGSPTHPWVIRSIRWF